MNTEVNTDNVALTQRLSSKTTKNYYTDDVRDIASTSIEYVELLKSYKVLCSSKDMFLRL